MATCTIAITFAHGYGLVAAHGCGACLAYFNNKLEAGMPDDFGDEGDDEDEVRGRPAGRGAGGGRGGGGRGGRGGRGGGKKKGRGKMSEAIQEVSCPATASIYHHRHHHHLHHLFLHHLHHLLYHPRRSTARTTSPR